MRGFLIITAAIVATALPAAPATAQHHERVRTGLSPTLGALNGSTLVRIHRRHDRRGDFRRRDHRRDGGDAFIGYREYQGDTLWRSSGFNDWWHDRPDRAFPRWVSRNRDCQRLWWSGGDWHC